MEKEDLRCLYKTSADMMKHFNSLLDKVRIIVVTTGLTVFAFGGTTFINKRIVWLPLLVSVWGMLLILSMLALAHHYIMHTEKIAEGAREVEKRLFERTNVRVANGAFHKIHEDHKKSDKIKKFILDYSTFIAMLIGCLSIFVFLLTQL